MRLTFLVLAFPAFLSAQLPTLQPNARRFASVTEPVVALTHVRVVDGTGAAPMEDQTVLLRDGKIAAVGRTVAVPAGARTIDLTGHTVIPGLVGLHDHSYYTSSGRAVQLNTSGPRMYLGSGVTTIRTTGSRSPYEELNLRWLIDSGRVAGPRMYVTGPYLTGESGVSGMYNVKTVADARRVVAYWASEGVSWLKFYTTVSREAMKAVIDEAHKHGVKVTGHLCSVTYKEAVGLGIDNLEHGLFASTDYSPTKKPDECPNDAMASYATLDVNSAAVKETFDVMIRNRVPMTSTLVVYELFVPNRPPLEQRVMDAMSTEVRAEYLMSRSRLAEPGSFGITPDVFRRAMAYELAFVRAGGLLAAGVDPTGNGGALPGFGDQRNYELLIEAGFTPVEAVQIMTANGARVLGAYERFGSITPGKIADIVVIRGNPIATPAEIRNVVTVFKDGIGYDSVRLLDSVKGLVGVR